MATNNVTPSKSDGDILTHVNWNQHSHDKGGLPANSTTMKTGSYSGDGGTGQAITGIGFSPKHLQIFESAGDPVKVETLDVFSAGVTFIHTGTPHDNITADDTHHGIRSLDSDGFTVSDGGADAFPNKNGRTYFYVSTGTG